MNYIFTGCANGIGNALCKLLVTEGDEVLLIDIDEDNLELVFEWCSEIKAKPTKSVCDVRNRLQMKRVIEDWCKKLKSSHLGIELYAVAGIAETSHDDSYEYTHAVSNMETNYFGVLNTVYPAIPFMKEPNKSLIAVISSTSSYRSTRRSGEYSASKAALGKWTEGMRFKLSGHKIAVCLIEPGFVWTRMTEGNTHFMPFIVSKEKMARLIVKAVSKRKQRTVLPKKALLYVGPTTILRTSWYTRIFLSLDKKLGPKK